MISFRPLKSVRTGIFGAATANERFGRSIMNKYVFGSSPYLGMLNLLYLDKTDDEADKRQERLYRFLINLRLQLKHGRINEEKNLFASQAFLVNQLEKLLVKQIVYKNGWKKHAHYLDLLDINGVNKKEKTNHSTNVLYMRELLVKRNANSSDVWSAEPVKAFVQVIASERESKSSVETQSRMDWRVTDRIIRAYRQSVADTLWTRRFRWLSSARRRTSAETTTTDIYVAKWIQRGVADLFNPDATGQRINGHEEATRSIREYAERYDILNRRLKLEWLLAESLGAYQLATEAMSEDLAAKRKSESPGVQNEKPVKAFARLTLSRLASVSSPLTRASSSGDESPVSLAKDEKIISTQVERQLVERQLVERQIAERISRSYRQSVADTLWTRRFRWLSSARRRTSAETATTDIYVAKWIQRGVPDLFNPDAAMQRINGHEEATQSIREYAERYDILNRRLKLEWLLAGSLGADQLAAEAMNGDLAAKWKSESAGAQNEKPVKAFARLTLSRLASVSSPLTRASSSGEESPVSLAKDEKIISTQVERQLLERQLLERQLVERQIAERISRSYRQSVADTLWKRRFRWLSSARKRTSAETAATDIYVAKWIQRGVADLFDLDATMQRINGHEEATRSIREYSERYDILNRRLKLEWLLAGSLGADQLAAEAMNGELAAKRKSESPGVQKEKPVKAFARLTLSRLASVSSPLARASSSGEESPVSLVKDEKITLTQVERQLTERQIAERISRSYRQSVADTLWTRRFRWLSSARRRTSAETTATKNDYVRWIQRGVTDLFDPDAAMQRINGHEEATRSIREYAERYDILNRRLKLEWLLAESLGADQLATEAMNEDHAVKRKSESPGVQHEKPVKAFARLTLSRLASVSSPLTRASSSGEESPVSLAKDEKITSTQVERQLVERQLVERQLLERQLVERQLVERQLVERQLTERQIAERISRSYRQSVADTLWKRRFRWLSSARKRTSAETAATDIYVAKWIQRGVADLFDPDATMQRINGHEEATRSISDYWARFDILNRKLRLVWLVTERAVSDEATAANRKPIKAAINVRHDFPSYNQTSQSPARTVQTNSRQKRELFIQLATTYRKLLADSIRRMNDGESASTVSDSAFYYEKIDRRTDSRFKSTNRKFVLNWLKTVSLSESISYGRISRDLGEPSDAGNTLAQSGLEWLFANREQGQGSIRQEAAEQDSRKVNLIQLLQSIRFDQRKLGSQTTESLKRYAQTVFTPIELQYIGYLSSTGEPASDRAVPILRHAATKTLLTKVYTLRQVVKSLVQSEQAEIRRDSVLGGKRRLRRNEKGADANRFSNANNSKKGRPTLADLRNTADAISMVVSRIGRSSSALSATTAQTLSLLFHQAIEKQSQTADQAVLERREMQINETEKVVPISSERDLASSVHTIVQTLQTVSFSSALRNLRLPSAMMSRSPIVERGAMNTWENMDRNAVVRPTLTHSTFNQSPAAAFIPSSAASGSDVAQMEYLMPTVAKDSQDQPGSNIKPVQFDFDVESSSPQSGQPPIDIEAIADKVYKEIEHRMRLEKMRRGY